MAALTSRLDSLFAPWPEGAFSWTERVHCQLGHCRHLCGDGHAIVLFVCFFILQKQGTGVKHVFCKSGSVKSTTIFNQTLFSSQVTNYSIYRPSVALRLPLLQMLDGERVTLEERTRAELLSIEEIVKTMHNMHKNRHVWTWCLSGARAEQ